MIFFVYILYVTLVFAIAMTVHELGHMLMLFEYSGKMPILRCSLRDGLVIGYREDYDRLSKGQYISVLLVGIMAGAIPLFVLNGVVFAVCLAAYSIWGCQSDIKNIWGILR